MKIILKSLTLDNFAGSNLETHTFNSDETTVSADNGVGKTRLQNAWIYLLFDKNAEDRKDFNIKNTFDLGKNLQEHIVSAVIEVDGSNIELKKIFKEKHVKKHGSKTTEFNRHETLYYYDGVPVQKGEYNKKIDALVQEDLFKLLTNVSFFNKMPWAKQREIILKLAPEVSDAEVAAGNEKFTALLDSLKNNKTLKEYKSQIAGQKKKLKDELTAIPIRIDQEMKARPESEDFDALETELERLGYQYDHIESVINNQLSAQNKANEDIRAKQQKVSDLKLQKQKIENDIKLAENSKGNDLTVKKQECRNKIDNTEREIDSIKRNASLTVANLETKNAEIVKMRNKFKEINSSELVINDDEFICPTCKTPIKEEEAESKRSELTKNFSETKAKRLSDINVVGGSLTSEIEEMNRKLVAFNTDLENAEAQLETFKAEFLELNKQTPDVTKTIDEIISSHPDHIAIVSEIKTAEAGIEKLEPVDQTELKSEKADVSSQIDAIKTRLNNKTIIESSVKRIDALKEQENTFAQELADLEHIENDITDFDKAKINAVEETVNAKFSLVKFKLFDFQVNGAEVPVCEAYIGGVPYSDTNYRNKIAAGLDVIRTLSKEHDVFAPIFIDNRESAFTIPEMESQIINLKAVEGLKSLVVS